LAIKWAKFMALEILGKAFQFMIDDTKRKVNFMIK
jgi:hypothetical protein